MINEIIIYQTDELSTRIEVRVDEDTVWLTQSQMAELFQTTPQNITIHIHNIYNEAELSINGTSKDFLQVQKEGKRTVNRKVQIYNLDVIISVGYRVKSLQGTQFRIWANKILKEYMIKGYAVNQRVDRIENDVHTIKKELGEIKLQLKTSLPANQGVFYDGQVFDAYVFVSELIKSAKISIVLIDNYIDESVLLLLSKRVPTVKATIYTKIISKQLELDLKKYNQQYPEISIKPFANAHDRFLIIDHKTVYHIGASLKDLGKKWFAFSKMEIEAMNMLNKIIEK